MKINEEENDSNSGSDKSVSQSKSKGKNESIKELEINKCIEPFLLNKDYEDEVLSNNSINLWKLEAEGEEESKNKNFNNLNYQIERKIFPNNLFE